MRLFQYIIIILSFIVLTACGGGSGGSNTPPASGGGSGGGGAVNTDTLSLSASAANFSATQFEATSEPQLIRASFSGDNTAGLVVGTLPGVESIPFWLNVELTQVTATSGDIIISVATTDLPEGRYDFTLRAVTGDANQNVLNQADIRIQYDVAAGVPLSISPQSINVEMHQNSPPVTETISVTAGNYMWSTIGIDANASVANGIGSQDVEIEIFPPMPDFLDANGEYTGVVDFVADESSGNHAIYEIKFKIFPTLESFNSEYVFNAISGDETTEPQGVNLKGQGLNWQASADQSWVVFSAMSGEIATDDALFENDGDDFSISIDPTNLSEGTHQAIVTVTAELEQSVEYSITVEVGAQKLSVSKRGVAFTDTPEFSNLSAMIDVGVNVDRVVNWSANSSVGWLTVTPSGTTNDNLVITADPASLANETVSEAVITISSLDTGITYDETIRLGLWKSSQAAATQPYETSNFLSKNQVLSDPIRPYSYVRTDETVISVINSYTGALVTTVSVGNEFSDYDVSDDGAFLYVVRSGDGEGFIDVINLSTNSAEASWAYPVERLLERDAQEIKFGRVAGAPYLFTSTQQILSARDGQVYGSYPKSRNQTVLTGLDVKNEVLCSIDSRTTESAVSCFDLNSAGFDGATVNAMNLGEGEYIVTDGGSDIKLSSDGQELYIRNRINIDVVDTSTLSLSRTIKDSADSINAFDVGDNGNLFVVSVDSSDFLNERRNVTTYTADGTILNSIDFPSLGGGIAPILSDFSLSADGQRMIYLLDGAILEVHFLSVE